MDAKEVAQWNKSADTYNNLSHATDIYQIVHKTIFLWVMNAIRILSKVQGLLC